MIPVHVAATWPELSISGPLRIDADESHSGLDQLAPQQIHLASMCPILFERMIQFPDMVGLAVQVECRQRGRVRQHVLCLVGETLHRLHFRTTRTQQTDIQI